MEDLCHARFIPAILAINLKKSLADGPFCGACGFLATGWRHCREYFCR
jgi:hypothetical protein